ncbi:segregation and condensation protein A [Desulfitobacterium sp.]|uniref:segregation and condensation protein A n=1 Tax=Desulfitobacterium sp. TaxID=49981 RepID=UPI002B213361|nr:segregation/condensation protein A [Desulfitobacterium sp.]MEA4902415.1 segregation/condensation protein A [Desulfitobacterium sp.]
MKKEVLAKPGPYIELPAFQGPLDLLLHLIQQEKIDIYDIPIAKIADQFIDAVRQMDDLDMEVTSEFLVLAAQLLYIKSRYLLPKLPKEEAEGEAEDPRQELVERLIAYRSFKEAALILGELEVSSGKKYFRTVDINEIRSQFKEEGDPLEGVAFTDLWEAFSHVIVRAEQGVETKTVEPDEISIDKMMDDVLRRVILHPHGTRFSQLIRGNSRMEVIMSFLALLELLKEGKIRCEQSAPQQDIHLLPTEKAWEFTEGE